MENFSDLLHQPNIALNLKNCDEETLLWKSLEVGDSDIMMDLLRAGCDVNITDKFKCSLLHKAIVKDVSLDIIHELIKRVANINTQRENGDTLLHDAIYCGKLDIVCMLLYYGADVNIPCNQNITPIMLAITENELEICEVLLKYYDDFSCKDFTGNTALHLAIMHKNPLAVDLLKADADVNCMADNGDFPLLNSLTYENGELFKMIWSRLDFQILLVSETPFLLTYINQSYFPTADWVEFLYLMLNSSVACRLIEHCRKYMQQENGEYGFLLNLLYTFIEKHVELNERITIIYMLLSLGAQTNVFDVYLAHQFYEFNEEVEAYVYAGHGIYHESIKPVPSFILALEDSFSTKQIFALFVHQIMGEDNVSVIGMDFNETLYSLGFFSLPHRLKQHLLSVCQIRWFNRHEVWEKVEEKLNLIPEIPSLFELCRNQVYKLIKHNCKIKKPYQFHDIVKSLNLPQLIKDVIRFRKPLY